MKRKGLPVAARNYHSLLWLEYAYLQEGRIADARQVLRGIQMPTPLAHMSATYAIETGDWDRSPAELHLAHENLLTNVSVLNVEGLIHLAHGRTEEARACAAAAKKRIDSPPSETSGAWPHSSMPMPESPNNRKFAQIMLQQLEGALLYAENKPAEAFQLLAQTASEEDALSFEFGPPTPLKPAHELYGELLLKAGRPQEARQQFELALQRTPNRALSLRGLAKAQTGSGDGAAAALTLARLNAFSH
jgi:predicted Zn-dependent protease